MADSLADIERLLGEAEPDTGERRAFSLLYQLTQLLRHSEANPRADSTSLLENLAEALRRDRALERVLSDQLLTVRAVLAGHGLTHPRLTSSGRLLVQLSPGSSIAELGAASQQLEEALGLDEYVSVVSDDVLNDPRHSPELDQALPF